MGQKRSSKSSQTVSVNRESNHMVDSIASAKLSKDEIRIIAKIVEAIRPKQNMKKRNEVTGSSFGEIILTFQYSDLVPEDYRRTDSVINALNSLRKREANTLSEDVDIVDGWISRAKHYKREGSVEIVIGRELLADYIALGDGYTEYMSETVFKLSSKYAIHIYKLLARNSDRKYFTFHLSHLRKYLSLEDGQYKTLKDFKRRILLPAYEELKVNGDVFFETDFNKKYDGSPDGVGQMKKGRKVTGYRIRIIDRKAQQKKNKNREEYLKNFLISYFEYVGIPQKDELAKRSIRKFADDFGTDDVIAKLTQIKGYVAKNAVKKSAYLLKALKGHFEKGARTPGDGKEGSSEAMVRGQKRQGRGNDPQNVKDILAQVLELNNSNRD